MERIERDSRTFSLVMTDDEKYHQFMDQYYTILNHKKNESATIEKRFKDLEDKTEANSILLKEIWNHLQNQHK